MTPIDRFLAPAVTTEIYDGTRARALALLAGSVNDISLIVQPGIPRPGIPIMVGQVLPITRGDVPTKIYVRSTVGGRILALIIEDCEECCLDLGGLIGSGGASLLVGIIDAAGDRLGIDAASAGAQVVVVDPAGLLLVNANGLFTNPRGIARGTLPASPGDGVSQSPSQTNTGQVGSVLVSDAIPEQFVDGENVSAALAVTILAAPGVGLRYYINEIAVQIPAGSVLGTIGIGDTVKTIWTIETLTVAGEARGLHRMYGILGERLGVNLPLQINAGGTAGIRVSVTGKIGR